ncbi:MAG: hypothetical protein U0992_23410 [Planctomycetaceae bacterium]
MSSLYFYLTAGVLSGVVFHAVVPVVRRLPAGQRSALRPWPLCLSSMRLWPHDLFYVFGIIPVQVMWLALIAVIVDVHPLLLDLGGVSSRDRVAHSAHFGGMLFALIYQRQNWRVTSLVDRIKVGDVRRVLKPKTKLRVYEPEKPANNDERLDELLAKVAEHGESSLTDAERAELVAFSRRYRDRQR